MPIPPNPEDFPTPKSLEAGREYIWVPGDFIARFQDEGYTFLNQFADSNGVRYNLMGRGTPNRHISADNVHPSISVHFPDHWGRDDVPVPELPEELEGPADPEESQTEFTLDAN